jgi:hypothetical protein
MFSPLQLTSDFILFHDLQYDKILSADRDEIIDFEDTDKTRSSANSTPHDHLVQHNTLTTPICSIDSADEIGGRSQFSCAMETEGSSLISQEEISDDDVYCERGGKSNLHPGNMRYRGLIMSYKRRYQETRLKTDKIRLSQEIVGAIKRKGGRFVKRVPKTSCYCEISDKDARLKISQALRERKILKLIR